jgi:hypothetical protein
MHSDDNNTTSQAKLARLIAAAPTIDLVHATCHDTLGDVFVDCAICVWSVCPGSIRTRTTSAPRRTAQRLRKRCCARPVDLVVPGCSGWHELEVDLTSLHCIHYRLRNWPSVGLECSARCLSCRQGKAKAGGDDSGQEDGHAGTGSAAGPPGKSCLAGPGSMCACACLDFPFKEVSPLRLEGQCTPECVLACQNFKMRSSFLAAGPVLVVATMTRQQEA